MSMDINIIFTIVRINFFSAFFFCEPTIKFMIYGIAAYTSIFISTVNQVIYCFKKSWHTFCYMDYVSKKTGGSK